MPRTARVITREGEELPVVIVRPTLAKKTSSEPPSTVKSQDGLGRQDSQSANVTIVSNPLALNRKRRSSNTDAERFQYYRHVEMSGDGRAQAYVIPETAQERQRWSTYATNPSLHSSRRQPPPAHSNFSGQQFTHHAVKWFPAEYPFLRYVPPAHNAVIAADVMRVPTQESYSRPYACYGMPDDYDKQQSYNYNNDNLHRSHHGYLVEVTNPHRHPPYEPVQQHQMYSHSQFGFQPQFRAHQGLQPAHNTPFVAGPVTQWATGPSAPPSYTSIMRMPVATRRVTSESGLGQTRTRSSSAASTEHSYAMKVKEDDRLTSNNSAKRVQVASTCTQGRPGKPRKKPLENRTIETRVTPFTGGYTLSAVEIDSEKDLSKVKQRKIVDKTLSVAHRMTGASEVATYDHGVHSGRCAGGYSINIPYGRNLVAKRSLFMPDCDRADVSAGRHSSPEVPHADTTAGSTFQTPIITSVCSLAHLQSNKLFVGSPGAWMSNRKTAVPSMRVKGRKTAVMKCNINAKVSQVAKTPVNSGSKILLRQTSTSPEEDITSKSSKQSRHSNDTSNMNNSRCAKQQKETAGLGLNKICQEGAIGPNTIIYYRGGEQATVIQRTTPAKDNDNGVSNFHISNFSSQCTVPEKRPEIVRRQEIVPNASLLQEVKPKKKSEEIRGSNAVTSAMVAHLSQEDPIPPHVKQRMKGCRTLEMVVSRLKGRMPGNSKESAIDLKEEMDNRRRECRSEQEKEIPLRGRCPLSNSPRSICSQDEREALEELSSEPIRNSQPL